MASPATSRRSPRELRAAGHEPRILAPFDPDDALSRRLHRGARPAARAPSPEGFVSLGRTVGIPANGAVSNMALTPARRVRAAPRAAPTAATTSSTSTSRSSRWSAGTRCARRRAAAGGHLPHLLGERAHQRLRRGPARRPAADEPPARADRRLRSRRLDRAALLRRALPDHPQRRPPRRQPGAGRGATAGERRRCGSCSSARPSNARACRCCCAPSRRCASTSRRP